MRCWSRSCAITRNISPLEDARASCCRIFSRCSTPTGDPDGLIRHGNERVLRARFNDARFFWQTDQKTPLRDAWNMLKSVTFQKDLGSYYDKTRRVQRLGSLIAKTVRRRVAGAPWHRLQIRPALQNGPDD